MNRFVYIVQASNGRIKIGISNNPDERFEYLAAMSPLTISLLHFFETSHAWHFEWRLHYFFDGDRHHGEWFDLLENQVEWLCSLEDDDWDDVVTITEPYMPYPDRSIPMKELKNRSEIAISRAMS